MPVRGSETLTVGHYKNDWKSWGNTIQSESKVGRRLSQSDTECQKRNMMISVVANINAQILVEIRASELSARYIEIGLMSLLAGFVAVL